MSEPPGEVSIAAFYRNTTLRYPRLFALVASLEACCSGCGVSCSKRGLIDDEVERLERKLIRFLQGRGWRSFGLDLLCDRCAKEKEERLKEVLP